MKVDYEFIKAEAAQRRADGATCAVTDLIALAPQNDPFYCGTETEQKNAEWFTELWQRFGYGSGVHLRRVHYQIVSQDPPVLKPNGKPYENTEGDWNFLNIAAKAARYLGMVDADLFVDRRNPEAQVNRYASDHDFTPGYEVTDSGGWEDYAMPTLPELPTLPYGLPNRPEYEVTGYRGVWWDVDAEQPYLVEIWAEKSTMNDVLIPLCKRYKVNLVTGLGELSITAVYDFLKRAKAIGKPARILYVSDFDPAGLEMPVSVARKVEFFQQDTEFSDLDIALRPVVLTTEQVASYKLPRVPVKDSDKRKGKFEKVNGAGQVELDALEALHPDALVSILEEQILQYYDPTLDRRMDDARSALEARLRDERQLVLDDHEAELVALEAAYDEILTDYERTRCDFAELVSDFQSRLDAYAQRLESIRKDGGAVYASIYSALDNLGLDAENEYPLPEPRLPVESNSLLYDSRRGYFAQLEYYKARQRGESESMSGGAE